MFLSFLYKRKSNKNFNELQKLSESCSNDEIREIIDLSIEPFGVYQLIVSIIIGFHNGLIAIMDIIPTFYGYTPERFICKGTQNESVCVPGCEEYEFFDSDTSIVTEWSLICDRRYLMALSTTIFFLGITVGSFFTGVLADKFGRKRVMVICLYGQGFFIVAEYFVQSYELFVSLRFIQGFFVMGLQNSSFTLLQELAPPRKMTFTCFFWGQGWTVGLFLLGGIAYFFRDWRTFQIICVVPTLMTLTWIWLVPESPNWFLAQNRKFEALSGAYRIAERNQDTSMFKIPQNSKETNSEVSSKTSSLMPLFTHQILRKHLISSIFAWFSVTVGYYGILFYLPALPGGVHLNFFIGAISEFLGQFVGYFSLKSSLLGRKYTVMGGQYLCGLSCIILGCLSMLPTDFPGRTWIFLTLALMGKFFILPAFMGSFIYGCELFPTVVRGSATGICGVASRLGSVLAPQILLLGEVVHSTFSMGTVAFFNILGGTAIIFVPETLNKKLPNTIEDAEEAWMKKK